MSDWKTKMLEDLKERRSNYEQMLEAVNVEITSYEEELENNVDLKEIIGKFYIEPESDRVFVVFGPALDHYTKKPLSDRVHIKHNTLSGHEEECSFYHGEHHMGIDRLEDCVEITEEDHDHIVEVWKRMTRKVSEEVKEIVSKGYAELREYTRSIKS